MTAFRLPASAPARWLEAGRQWLGVAVLCLPLAACGASGPDENRHAQPPASGGQGEPQKASTGLEGAVAGLVQSLGSEDDEERQRAIDALAAMGPPVIDLVAVVLRDPSAEQRAGAVEVLSEIGGPPTVPPLLEALRDSSEDVRLMAVEALGEVRDPRAVQPLLELYGRDEDAQVRYECLTSLGLIGDPAAAPLLVRETRDDHPFVRVWAIDALCTMNDAQAAERALALLGDSDRGVRRRVLRACRRALDNAEGHRALLAIALHDEDVDLAVFARFDLRSYLEGPGGAQLAEEIRAPAVSALQAGSADMLRAALLLGELRDGRATTRLIEALHDPNHVIRDHATLLLGRIGDPRAVPGLIETLNDPLPMIRATAHNSLAWIAADGDPRAQEAVKAYTGPKFSRPVPR
jgi:HEAT repeat protein